MEDLLDSPVLSPKLNVRYAAPIVWFSLLTVGLIFRTMHWPFGSELIICSSAALMAFSFSKMIFLTRFTNIPMIVIGLASVIWTLIFLWGAFFNGGYPYNSKALTLYGISFGILAVIHSAINFSLRRRFK